MVLVIKNRHSQIACTTHSLAGVQSAALPYSAMTFTTASFTCENVILLLTLVLWLRIASQAYGLAACKLVASCV
eukprot:3047807-Pleurochrysis_carterae.AAC.5